MPFALHSPAFQNGGAIPDQYSRDEENRSPPLRWTDPPEGTRSFALVVEDTDSRPGVFRHWAIYGLPPGQSELAEGAGGAESGARQGVNDFGKARYDGPQPAVGDGPHHYHFRLLALDVPNLEAEPGATAERVLQIARSRAIGETELVGTYAR